MHLRTMPFFGLVNYIPVIATVVTTILSVVLARATLRYAESSDKSLALAREEFEREWSPELHIKLEKVSSSEIKLIVTNLARISVLLQMVQVRKLAQAVPSERYFLNEPLVGGMTWTESFWKRLMVATAENFHGPIAVSVTFYASSRLFRTDWFRFQVAVKDGNVTQLDALNIAARRVRVLESRSGPPSPRRELVRDAASTLAKEDTVPRS
jgi:cell division protein FtsL